LSSWKEVELGSVGMLTMGQSPPSEYYNSVRQGIPFLQGCAQFGEHTPASDVYAAAGNKIARPESVLISVRAPVGRLNVADQTYVIGRGVAAIEGRGHSTRFLYHLLNNATTQLEAVAQGSTFSAINSSQLRSFKVLVPTDPTVEQAIVELLDLIGTCIEHQQFVIAKQERVRAGLLQALLTRGIDENGEIRDASSEVPGMGYPATWQRKTIESLANTYAGGTPSRGGADSYGGHIPWVKSGEVNLDCIEETEESLSDIGLKSSAARWVPENTPLMAMYGATAGVVSWLAIRATTNQAVLAMVPRKDVDGRWLYWSAKRISPKLVFHAQGSGQPNLSKKMIDEFLIWTPLYEEQCEISKILDAQTKVIKRAAQTYEKLRNIKTGLMRDLLNGRVSVEPLLDLPPASTAKMEKP